MTTPAAPTTLFDARRAFRSLRGKAGGEPESYTFGGLDYGQAELVGSPDFLVRADDSEEWAPGEWAAGLPEDVVQRVLEARGEVPFRLDDAGAFRPALGSSSIDRRWLYGGAALLLLLVLSR